MLSDQCQKFHITKDVKRSDDISICTDLDHGIMGVDATFYSVALSLLWLNTKHPIFGAGTGKSRRLAVMLNLT